MHVGNMEDPVSEENSQAALDKSNNFSRMYRYHATRSSYAINLEVAQMNDAAGTVLHFGFASGLRRSRAVEPANGPVR
jgi:hypothetical protein